MDFAESFILLTLQAAKRTNWELHKIVVMKAMRNLSIMTPDIKGKSLTVSLSELYISSMETQAICQASMKQFQTKPRKESSKVVTWCVTGSNPAFRLCNSLKRQELMKTTIDGCLQK